MLKKILFVFLIVFFYGCAHNKPYLLVLHTSEFDGGDIINMWLNNSDLSEYEVFYLTTEDAPAGHHQIDCTDKHVLLTGLYFKSCVTNAIEASLNSGALSVTLPMYGVMVGQHRTIKEQLVESRQDRNVFIQEYIGQHLYMSIPNIVVRVVDDYILITRTE